jgi:hypothetical protein
LSDGFTKLFGSLIHSTIWREKDHVRLVWITMLAMVNRHGVVEASLPGVADAARVTIEECEEAIARLHAPDPYSRSKAHEGRRIKTVDGGWQLLNYDTYRRRMSAEDQREKAAERQQRFRDNHPKPRTTSERPSPNVTERPPERSGDDSAERSPERSPEPRQDETESRNGRVTPRNGSNDIAEADREAEADQDQENPAIVEPPSDRKPRKNAAARLVFDAWVATTRRTKATVFDKKRQARIAARLQEGFTPDQLCLAIANHVNDPFLMGKNDRSQVYDGIETLLRDAAQVERLMALTAPVRGAKPTGPRQGLRAADLLDRQLQRVADLEAAERAGEANQ